ncbi:AraC family transcriptional regulator [Chryseobacterium formosense]|uniref:AraC family transcriptional regulator n=1 Tax=Chryseobacterium formosense TaxID=236814 RepID=A0A085Z9I5_9FLAO|nr:helix-turn-helix transcriptional regulator [Chryseobacterium formosense]KFF01099.1 AraC family transcriptional regulator [Chryseobacterium formosense]SFT42181.1 transcriptional regulator, AraC family [Chryseobacterium formosense]
MANRKLYSIDTVSELHKISGLPQPQHPLISLVDYSQVEYQIEESEISWIQDLYFIGFKRDLQGKLHYGQSQYDFDGGLLCFIAPRQLVKMIIEKYDKKPSGYLLAFHPDFIWNTPLAKTIHQYEFFGYDVNEALFLSEKEEETLIGLFKGIEKEYQSGIDQFTQNIIISQIEVILNYCERFYQRQFITRKKSNHQILDKLELFLEQYFTGEKIINNGLPTAQSIAEQLNVSTNYLSSLLKSLTGQTTQQHIHGKLIEKAKEKLSTTELTVSEIAYELGFEHSQSFSKLFKSKTDISPLEFRKSFN